MDRPLDLLTPQELLALAIEATRRGDSGHSMAYLKSAAERADTGPEVLFLLGSEYAQVGMVDAACDCMQRALEAAPGYAIARFQLGLLQLTMGQPDAALQTWQPLELEDPLTSPSRYLLAFHQGLRHLIHDEFEGVVTHLERGILLNQDNPALNENMQKIVDEVRPLAAKAAAASSTPSGDEAGAEMDAGAHLFLNAYTGGKPH